MSNKEIVRFIDLAFEIERKINPDVTRAWIKSHKCPYEYDLMPSPYIVTQDESGNPIEICLCTEENRDCVACWNENTYGPNVLNESSQLINNNNGGTN